MKRDKPMTIRMRDVRKSIRKPMPPPRRVIADKRRKYQQKEKETECEDSERW